MKIKDLFHFAKGPLQSTKATPGEYDFITAAASWKSHNEFTHDCEALVFAAAASGSLGRTHYVNGKFISSDLCFIITPKDPDKYPIDLKFYHLIFLAFKDEIVRNTKSGTSKEAIGLTVFGKYELPYFDIEKQLETREEFVNAQESTNKLDSELFHQLDMVKQLRQAFLKEAMQGHLVPQDQNDESASILLKKIQAKKEHLVKDKKLKKQKTMAPITEEEVPFSIPENWVWCRLGEISLSANNGLYKPSNFYKPTGYISLRMFNIQDGKIVLDKAKRVVLNEKEIETYGLEINDLLVNRVNSLELVGKTARIDSLREPMVYESMNIRLRLSMKEKMAEFINLLLLEKRGKQYFTSVAKIANGQVSINQTHLFNFLVPLAPLSEQKRITTKFNGLMSQCDALEARIIVSQRQNELLLKQVLTEALGLKNQEFASQKKTSTAEQRTSKYDPNTTLMEIVTLLKKHGKLHAEELWKMSKYPDDIDAFYAELKKQIEFRKTVKESSEKGYLELA